VRLPTDEANEITVYLNPEDAGGETPPLRFDNPEVKSPDSSGGGGGMGVDEPCASKGVPRRELESVGGSRRWRMKQGEESAAVKKNKYSRGSGTQIFLGTASGREERP